jgi:hypothetical protein
MRKITLMFLLIGSTMLSQTTVNFDSSLPWQGFMNVFETPANGGGFIFASGWGVADLVVQVNTINNTATLKPNRINDLDPFWQTGNLLGNKVMNASFFVNNSTDLVNIPFTFTGEVLTNNLDAEYVEKAFIRIFDGSFNLLREITADLTPGNFSLFYDNSEGAAGVNVQYGFNMVGRNVNPQAAFDAGYDALGSVVVTQSTLSLNNFEKEAFALYPNPVQNILNIENSQSNIQEVQLYDLTGRLLTRIRPDRNFANVDFSNLSNGIYLLKVTSDEKTITKKIIKN